MLVDSSNGDRSGSQAFCNTAARIGALSIVFGPTWRTITRYYALRAYVFVGLVVSS
jgi:hypothetical protein